MILAEPAPAKLNLALHVRGKLPDERHALETVFAFCADGDQIEAEAADRLSLEIVGPFAESLSSEDNLVLRAALALQAEARYRAGAQLRLTKKLPVAAGIGGGSADAAATLRLLTRLWGLNPTHASAVAPRIGADIPACLLSLTARGEGAGDLLRVLNCPGTARTPVLLVNPGIALQTRDVFSSWDGVDRGALDDWRVGRNDLEAPARALVPEIGDVLDWLAGRSGTNFVRMSGSGATCFALFDDEGVRDEAAAACPPNWWHLASNLR